MRFCFLLLILGCTANAELRFAGVFSDHLVLQAELELPVWGSGAEAGARVDVTFRDKAVRTTANDKGEWRVTLPPLNTDRVVVGVPPEGRTLIVRCGKA